jgi:hypothetical protein
MSASELARMSPSTLNGSRAAVPGVYPCVRARVLMCWKLTIAAITETARTVRPAAQL